MTKRAQAIGPSVAVIHFDPARIASLRVEEREAIAYHMVRLLSGEPTALSEWKHYGIMLDCEPDTDQGDE